MTLAKSVFPIILGLLVMASVFYVSGIQAASADSTRFPETGADPHADLYLRVFVKEVDIKKLAVLMDIEVVALFQEGRNDIEANQTYILLLRSSGIMEIRLPDTRSTIGNRPTFMGVARDVQWPIRGTPQWFPFDKYTIDIPIYRINYALSESIVLDQSSYRIYSAGVDGPNRIWVTTLFNLPGQYYQESGRVGVRLDLQRPTLNNFVYGLTLPLFFLYLLLGASLYMDHRSFQTRISVYVAQMIFTGTFFFSIQNLLPFQSATSILEFLIIGLFMSIALMMFMYVRRVVRMESLVVYKNDLKKSEITSLILSMATLMILFPILFEPWEYSVPIGARMLVIACLLSPLLVGLDAWRSRRFKWN